MRKIASVLSSTWLNSLVSFLGIAIGIATLVGVNIEPIIANYLYIVLGVELVIIMFIFATRPKGVISQPIPRNVANSRVYDKSFTLLTRRVFDQVRQMEDGFVTVYGTQVREAQTLFADLYSDLDIPFIKAADICTNPGILLTRTAYHEKNEDFIKKGGKINRLFILERSKLSEPDFFENLRAVIELNNRMGVSVRLCLQEALMSDEAQDYILYGRSVVLVEGKQADRDYAFSTANIYFQKSRIDEYSTIFDTAWERHGVSDLTKLVGAAESHPSSTDLQ